MRHVLKSTGLTPISDISPAALAATPGHGHDTGLNFPEETLYLQWEAQPTTGDTTFPRGNSAVSPVESPVVPPDHELPVPS